MEPEIEHSSDGIGENEALLVSVSRQERPTGSVIPPTNRRPQNPEASTSSTMWCAPTRPSMNIHGETKTSLPSSVESPDSLLSRGTGGTPAGCYSEAPEGGGDGSRPSAGVPSIPQIEHSVMLHLGDTYSSSNATAVGDGARANRLQMQQRSEHELGEEGGGMASGAPAVSRGASRALVAAARVSTRLVSASGPVANNTAARWRRAAAAFSTPRSSARPSDSPGGGASSRGVSRHGDRRGGQGLAAQRTLRELADEGGRRGSVSRQRMRTGELRRAQEDVEREAGESGSRESGDGAREEMSGEQSGASSSGGQSESGAVMEPAPADIRRALASSHNTISLLLLLLLHYVVTHIVAMAAFFVGTVLLLHLDRHLRSHAEAQVLKSRFILVGVASTAAFTVGLSAAVFNRFPGGEGLLRGLLLEAPKPDVSHISAVIGRTVVVDLWARYLSVIVKAVLALLSARESNSGSNNTGRCPAGCLPGRLASCGCLHRCRRRFDASRVGGRDRTRFGVSLRRNHEGDGDESTGDDGSQDSRDARRLCGARRWCGCGGRGEEPRRVATESDDERGNDGDGEAGRGREGERSTVVLSRAGRQRRVNAMVEMVFLLYRCVLPVPVWIEFYSRDGGYFAAVYLVLKGMEVSYRTDRLARAACYIRRGDLDRGKFATPEEVAEAGSPDCPICYERMERPLLLPCSHIFCVECVAEWLDRERTCPLCRAEFATSNPIPRSLRDGRTTVVPQIL